MVTVLAPLGALVPMIDELSDEAVEPGLGIMTTGVVAGLEVVLAGVVVTEDEAVELEVELEVLFAEVEEADGVGVGETRPVCGPLISFSITKNSPVCAKMFVILPFWTNSREYSGPGSTSGIWKVIAEFGVGTLFAIARF